MVNFRIITIIKAVTIFGRLRNRSASDRGFCRRGRYFFTTPDFSLFARGLPLRARGTSPYPSGSPPIAAELPPPTESVPPSGEDAPSVVVEVDPPVEAVAFSPGAVDGFICFVLSGSEGFCSREIGFPCWSGRTGPPGAEDFSGDGSIELDNR